MPQLDTTWFISQLFWLFICFFTMLFIMSKIFLPKITKVLNLRQRKIDDYLVRAHSIKEQAEASLQKYHDALDKATKEANVSLEKTKQELSDYMTKKQSDLTTKLNKKIAEGEAKIDQSKQESLKQIKSMAEELAFDITKKIGLKDISAPDIKNAVNKAAND